MQIPYTNTSCLKYEAVSKLTGLDNSKGEKYTWSLVGLKNVKAPLAAAPRSTRGLAGFCPDVLVTQTIF